MHGPEGLSGARSVFLLRPDNLGDAVLFSGALRHLRAHFPGAEITLCAKRYTLELLELCPYVDHRLAWEDLQWTWLDLLPRFRGRERLAARVRRITLPRKRLTADVVLLPLRSPTAAAHAAAAAIRADARYAVAGDSVNLRKSRGEERIYTECLRLAPERQRQHELEVTRDYLRFLGISVTRDEVWPEFWTHAEDRRWAEEAVPQGGGLTTLGICPGVTSLPGKFYPGESYARALELLPDRRFRVVLFGSRAERPLCEEVEGALSGCSNVEQVTNYAGRSTVRQLVEGLRRCDAVLAQETASLHVATALRRPTVGILGGGHFGRFYPWGNPGINRVAHQPMECFGCNWRCPYATLRCIQEITPDTVARELRAALKNAGVDDGP